MIHLVSVGEYNQRLSRLKSYHCLFELLLLGKSGVLDCGFGDTGSKVWLWKGNRGECGFIQAKLMIFCVIPFEKSILDCLVTRNSPSGGPQI
jgi:hypothetical protein